MYVCDVHVCVCIVPQGVPVPNPIGSIPIAEQGLPVLGTAYEGEKKTSFMCDRAARAPAIEWLAAAKELAKQCAEMAASSLDVPTTQAAWCILQKVVARALDYDARILPPSLIIPLARDLEQTIRATAETIMQVPKGSLADETWRQMTLPTSVGGTVQYPTLPPTAT